MDIEKIKANLFIHISKDKLKWTKQREEILRYFLEEKGHPTVEEFYEKLKSKNCHIGIATLYRTLKLFRKYNIAREVILDDGKIRYEPINPKDRHDHLICLKCGKTIEFWSEKLNEIEDLIGKENDFLVIRHSYCLYGICKECRQKS